MPPRFKQTMRAAIARVLSRVLPRNIMRDERFFDLWQSRGYHVMPLSFYNPIPDTRQIPGEHFSKVSELVGIDLRDAAQVDLFNAFCQRYGAEAGARIGDGVLGIDWFVLHCMARSLKPRRVIEIGSGISTQVTAEALVMNAEDDGGACDFTAIEPYPSEILRRGFPGLDRLVASEVQDVPLATFETLGRNDILFIDSSHMLKIGSDVQYEFMEILPRLKPGVMVHVHDIFFPLDYGRDFVIGRKAFWNEQYMLQAFLAFNHCYQVAWCSSWMKYHHADMLARSGIEDADAGSRPGSFWMRRIQ